jgi:hypothetical protein
MSYNFTYPQHKERSRMKLKPLVAVSMFLSFTAAAFAQATFTIGSSPVTTVVESGYAEITGEIVFTPINPAANLTVPGTITIDYGDTPITFMGGVFVDGLIVGGPTATLGIGADNTQLVITVTPGTGVDDYSIHLYGVQVQVAGDPGVAPLDAHLTSTGNLIVAGQTDPRVLNAVHSGIASLSASAPVRIHTVNGIINGNTQTTLTIVEGFSSAFGVSMFWDPPQTNAQQMRIVLDKQVPDGITIQFPTSDESGKWARIGDGTLTSADIVPEVFYQVVFDTDSSSVETLQITVSVTAVEQPYASAPLYASVSLAPIHFAGSAARPRYAYAPVGSAPIVSFHNPTTKLFDMDGDRISDIGVWRPDSGTWYVLPSGFPGWFARIQFGKQGDIPVSGNFDEDGKSDIAVWRPESSTWFVRESGDPGDYKVTPWGMSSDKPVAADYDGDGKVDIAVWRPEDGGWYVLPSGDPGNYEITQWGISSDTPVPADYDGDGIADIAVWRPESGTWFILESSNPGNYAIAQWGISSDTPVPADYDGDCIDDIAVWRPDSATWFILESGDPGNYTVTPWGMTSDKPVAADYDGDDIPDIAVWRPESGTWFILPSGSPGDYTAVIWGAPTDIPVH